MNKIVGLVFLAFGSLAAAQDLNDKDLQTKYVLGLLKGSKTMFFVSDSWKKAIAKEGATARTHLYKPLYSYFIIKHNGDTVEVASQVTLKDQKSELLGQDSHTNCVRSAGMFVQYSCTTRIPVNIFMEQIQKKTK